jgi:Bacterial Ig-like domain (group 2)
MMKSITAGRLAVALALGGIAAACKSDAVGVEGSDVASVEVTSEVGTQFDVGASAQLLATAKDADGQAVGRVQLTWTSSDSSTVSITSSGSMDALDVGTATIRVTAANVQGSIEVRVVDADLGGVTALATDAFVTALIGSASSDARTRLEPAMADCTAGASQGHLDVIQNCLTAIRTEITGTSDSTDRAVLAVLALFIDRIEQLLNL